MECPKCECSKTTVKDSRKIELNVFRRRKCKECGYIFYTEEIAIEQDEARVYMAFSKQKQRVKAK